MSPNAYLDYPQLKQVLFSEVEPLFRNRPHVIKKWREQANQLSDKERRYQQPSGEDFSTSFGVLWYLFAQCLFYQMPIQQSLIKATVQQHAEVLQTILLPFIRQEFPKEEQKYSLQPKLVDETLRNRYLYTCMETEWHLLREVVADATCFQKGRESYQAELRDSRGVVKGKVEWIPPTPQPFPKSYFDDLTADLLDILAYWWLVTPKSVDGTVDFHLLDMLILRHVRPRMVRGKQAGYREEDRLSIYNRLLALSQLRVRWEKEDESFRSKVMKSDPLFILQESVGADIPFMVKLKLTPSIRSLIEGAKKSIGMLPIQGLCYNPRTQRTHKRLTRYFAWQFKIRSIRRNYSQPFKISTLLRVVKMRPSLTGEEIRNRLEEALDDLQRDGVIQRWEYDGDFEERRVGVKGWIQHYYLHKQILIEPPQHVKEGNSTSTFLMARQQSHTNILHQIMEMSLENRLLVEEETRLGQAGDIGTFEGFPTTLRKPRNNHGNSPNKVVTLAHQVQQATVNIPEVDFSPKGIRTERERRGLSVRQASKEIGIAHTTLSRYEKGEISRLNHRNHLSLKKWSEWSGLKNRPMLSQITK